jgi:hypothetical protein
MNELLQLTSNNSSAGERSALSTSHLKMVTLLFALCCKKGRDSRSFDLAHLVESHQLAPLRAYAAKTGRINLTKKVFSTLIFKFFNSILDRRTLQQFIDWFSIIFNSNFCIFTRSN